MSDFDDINNMIRKELESDKNRVDSIAMALTERLEALVKSLIERTIKLGKRQFFVSIPMSLDNSYYFPAYYDEDESPVWIARKHIRDEDWTGHLSTTFDIKLTNQFERINFQMIIDILEGIFERISVESIHRFGRLELRKREATSENYEWVQGYEMFLGNFFRDNDGYWDTQLTFPDFFVKKSDDVPVFFVSTNFELRNRTMDDYSDDIFSCLPVNVDNDEDYSNYSGFFHFGSIRAIHSDEGATVTNTSEWIQRRINYFIQFK